MARLAVADLLAALAAAGAARRFGLLLLQFGQLRDGRLEPFELLGRGPFARRPLPRRQSRMLRRVQLIAQLPDMLAGLAKQLFKPLLAAETARPGAYTDPHAVLAHAAHMHYVLVHQRRDHLRKQPIQRRRVVGAEVRQQAVIHANPAAQPAESSAVFAAPSQLPRRADAANAGV
jgi:hypothetical protein